MDKQIILTKCFSALALPIMACVMLSGCCKEDDSDFPAKVKAYYDKDFAAADEDNACSAYFDLSNGIIEAYKTNPNAQQFMKQCVNRLTSGEACAVYSLAEDRIEPLELKQTALFNKIVDASSYQRQMAPIEKTLNQIAEQGKSALLVTDFEEYTPDKRVQHASFAAPYFQKWLQGGRDITFFVFNYTEGKSSKHLYFIVFDKKQHQLLKLIKESMNGVTADGEFTLSPDAYSCTTEYPSSTKGGNYHMSDGTEDIVTSVVETGTGNCYTNYGESSRMEYYPIGNTWNDIKTNAEAAAEVGNNPRYTHLLRNLFFDFSNQDSYIIKKLRLRVTNVERDFQKFTAYQLWQTDKDLYANTYDSVDEAGNAQLLPEHDYAAGAGESVEIKDMFELDQKLFDESFRASDGKKTEIGIGFSKNFTGNPVGADDSDMLRVDVIIDESDPNLGPSLDNLFVWGSNNSLRDAIAVTLQNLKPSGTIIYTYFLRMAE